MSYILILGAASDIAKAVAAEYAKQGKSLYLATRAQEKEEAEATATDLKVKYNIEAETVEVDAVDFASHADFYEKLDPKPEGTLLFIGYLGDQIKAQADFEETQRIINTNYVGAVSLLNVIANDYESKKSGFIVGVSSVAGDRGRQSNYLYGSAKAGLTAYLSGLRHRLYASGVHVVTVKPGFVNTRMTEGMDLPAKLTAEPEEVARDIVKAQQKRKNTIYTKWFWRCVMMVITSIPEFVFKKTKL
ncbi:MAG: SDR family oxidoreductase [Gammaproteobacteria bacterium]|nr:MAG: SDR family oxidoreductase [Gammaproteobacteria bacterium]